MSPKGIFSQLSLWNVNFCLKSYTFCFYFIIFCHVWIRIGFLNTSTDTDPQHCGKAGTYYFIFNALIFFHSWTIPVNPPIYILKSGKSVIIFFFSQYLFVHRIIYFSRSPKSTSFSRPKNKKEQHFTTKISNSSK